MFAIFTSNGLASPAIIGSADMSDYARGVAVSGGFAYVADR
ncbi:MAG: hypothetical protein GY874_00995 [Desulfobacteraceae bacterium]|nr:hypothetical protein [Desulfobacteraceae bacterium]